MLFPLTDGIRLIQRILQNKYSCVHINPSLNAKAVLRDGLSLILLRVLGFRRNLVCFHGWEDTFADKIRNRTIWTTLFRMVYGRENTILVLATRFRDALMDMGFSREQVKVITTSFDGRIFKGLERRNTSIRKLLFLSRFIPEKGIYELLEGFREMAHRVPRLTLVMAGDGPDRDRMIQWVHDQGLIDRVEFPGYLRGQAKAQALIDADLFVFPTYHGEGCPVSLLEAMAAGLPVVTTRAGGIPDIFEDTKNGIFLNEVHPAAIAQAVTRLLDDKELHSRIQKNNMEHAWQNFEAHKVAQKMEKIYCEVSGG